MAVQTKNPKKETSLKMSRRGERELKKTRKADQVVNLGDPRKDANGRNKSMK